MEAIKYYDGEEPIIFYQAIFYTGNGSAGITSRNYKTSAGAIRAAKNIATLKTDIPHKLEKKQYL